MFYLLQTDTIQKALGAAAASTPEKISMLSLLEKGGWIMYPLYFLLVAAIYVFVERLLAINKASRIEPNFMNIIRDKLVKKKIINESLIFGCHCQNFFSKFTNYE